MLEVVQEPERTYVPDRDDQAIADRGDPMLRRGDTHVEFLRSRDDI